MTYRSVSADKLRWGQIALLALACFWGVDYLITPDWAITPSMSVVEATMPIPVWGMLFLTFGVMGLAGEAWLEMGRYKPPHLQPDWAPLRVENRWFVAYVAHVFLCALYGTVGVGYLLNQMVAGHLWGMRSALLMWMVAYGHFVFINRRGGDRVS